MPDKYFVMDLGDAIIYNGNAMEKVEESVVPFDASTADVSTVSIGSFVYNIADDQGKSSYTAGQEALSYYEFGFVNKALGAGSDIEFSIPVTGVLRLWGMRYFRWFLNGADQGRFNSDKIDATPGNVTAGDLIRVLAEDSITRWFNVGLLPFVHADGQVGPKIIV